MDARNDNAGDDQIAAAVARVIAVSEDLLRRLANL